MGLPGPKPMVFFGNFLKVLRVGLGKYDVEIIKKYGKTIGYFEGEQPVIMTTDVKFIKSVMIKDFGHFINRRVFFFPKFKIIKFIF